MYVVFLMKTFFRLFILATAGVLASSAVADTPACRDCAPRAQEDAISHRDQLKADRAKYDRENDKLTARPWDTIRNEKPQPLPEKSN